MISPRMSPHTSAQGDAPRHDTEAAGGSAPGSSPSASMRHSGSWRSCFSSGTSLVPGARRAVPPPESIKRATALAASPGGSWVGVSPGLSVGMPTPPRPSGFASTRVSDGLPSTPRPSLDVVRAGKLSLSPVSFAQFDRDVAAPPSRPASAELSPEPRRSGRLSSGSWIPDVSGVPSVEDVVWAAEDSRPASCEVAEAESGAGASSLGSALVPVAMGPAAGNGAPRRSSSYGACAAKRPVATVSIATLKFWLRFENIEIEAM